MGLPMDKSYLLTQLRNFKSIILDPAYIIQKTTLPTATVDLEGVVYQYIGNSSSLTLGGFYQCQSDGAVSPTYSWVEIPVKIDTDGTTVLKNANGELYVPTATTSALGLVKAGDGTTMNDGALDVVDRIKMVSLMPTASASLVGTAVMFLGTTGTYTRGSIYECVSDGESTPTYSWEILLNSDSAAEIANEAATRSALGAKNLLSYPYVDTTKEINGITFTDNGDGTITANGTASGIAQFYCKTRSSNNYYLPVGEYIVSGCPEGGGNSTFVVQVVHTEDSSAVTDATDAGSGASFTRSSANLATGILISVASGTVLDNLVFKPMIRLATDINSTYQPYTKTNQELTNDKAEQTEVDDIFNVYGAKNLNSYPYLETTRVQNGITFTDNNDGTIKVNGTATADANFTCHSRYVNYANPLVLNNGVYILSGTPKNAPTGLYLKCGRTYSGTYNEYGKDRGKGLTVILNGDDYDANKVNLQIQIGVQSGTTVNNLIIKPMIRLASVKDDTWEPYVPTNRQLLSHKDNGILGAKNLNSYPYANTTKVSSGVTFTDMGDGTIKANGTASEDAYFFCHLRQLDSKNNLILPNGKYILSGCPSGGSSSTYMIGANRTYNGASQNLGANDYGNGTIISLQGDDYFSDKVNIQIPIVIKSGATVNNLVFKPMIRLASDTDSTYQPYAKTNKQLTDDAEALTSQANDMVNVLGAKNVLPFPYYAGSGTYNGVTITDNGDGSITLDGTCTGMSFFVFYGGRYSLAPTTFVKKNEDYIATLEVVSGSMAINSGTSRFVFRNYITNATSPFVDIFYEDNVIDTRSVKFTYEPTASYDTSLVWYEFNVGTTFNNWRIRPMIRLASITDDTYEPYAKTNQQLTQDTTALLDNLEVNGAVNMLPNNATSQVKYGVTFTVNDDGTVTANGTAENNTSTTTTVTLPAGNYILSGCPSGGSGNKYRIAINNSDTSTNLGFDYGSGFEFTLNAKTNLIVYFDIRSGYIANNLTFYPMITVSSYNGPYVPYAKSNKELTEELTVASGEITRLVSFSTLSSYRARKYGKVVELYFAGTLSEAVNIWTDFLTVPDGFRPSHYVQIVSFNTYNSCKNLQLAPSGGIQSAYNLASGDFIRFTVTYIID